MDETGQAGRRTRRTWSLAALVAALILYVPHVAPLFGEHLSRDSSCRANWLEMFGVLPGLLGSTWALNLVDVQTGEARRWVAAVLCLAVWAALTVLLTRGPRVRWGAGLAALAWFSLNAMALDAVFAM